MSERSGDKNDEASIWPRPVPGAELCEQTETFADYWEKGAWNEPNRESALTRMEQAVNGWKNLAYAFARQVHFAQRSGYASPPWSKANMLLEPCSKPEAVPSHELHTNTPDEGRSELAGALASGTSTKAQAEGAATACARSHADAPEVSAQGASEGKESADVRCASSPSATAASAPERPAFTPEAWAAAEWAIPLHMHPYDWNVADCPGDYKAPTPGQVRGYIAQAVHRHQQQVEQPSIDRLKRELTEWKIKAKTWQQIADQRAIEAADLKVAAAISAGPCTETALCRLGWIVRDNEIARLKAELAKATAAKAIVAHDSGRNI